MSHDDDAVRSLAARRHLPDSHLAKWLAMDPDSRASLLEAAERLRLRTGQLVSAIDLLDEIAVREKQVPAAILARDEIRRASSGAASAPALAAAFLDALRAIRFPSLARAMGRISAALAALRLPAGLNVVLPKDLHSDELIVRLSARTGRELRELLKALREKEDELVRIAGMLSGDDEV